MTRFIFFALMATFIQSRIYPMGNFGVVGLSLQNVVMYLSALMLVSSAATNGRLVRLKIPGLMPLCIAFAVVVFSIFLVARFGKVPVDLMTNARSVKVFVFHPILLYAMSFLLVQNARQGLRLLAMFAIVIGAINVISLVMAGLGVTPARVSEMYESDNRFAGFTGNANKTAYLLCMFFPIHYFFAKVEKRKAVALVYYGILIASVASIILSGSRGGVIGLVLGAFLTARIWGDYKKLVVLPAIFLPILLAVMFMVENDYVVRTLERFASVTSSDASVATGSRIDIWSALLKEFISTPQSILFGKGYGVSRYIGFGARAHNMYLMVLVEFGMLGLVLWVYAIIRAFKYVRNLAIVGREMELLRSSVVVSMYLILVTWMFTTLIGVQEFISMMFGLSIATLTSRSAASRSRDNRNAKEGAAGATVY